MLLRCRSSLRHVPDSGVLSTLGAVFRVETNSLLWSNTIIFTGGPNLDGQVLDFVQESLDSFVADIFRSRRTEAVSGLLSVWDKQPPMTSAQFNKMVSEQLQSN